MNINQIQSQYQILIAYHEKLIETFAKLLNQFQKQQTEILILKKTNQVFQDIIKSNDIWKNLKLNKIKMSSGHVNIQLKRQDVNQRSHEQTKNFIGNQSLEVQQTEKKPKKIQELEKTPAKNISQYGQQNTVKQKNEQEFFSQQNEELLQQLDEERRKNNDLINNHLMLIQDLTKIYKLSKMNKNRNSEDEDDEENAEEDNQPISDAKLLKQLKQNLQQLVDEIAEYEENERNLKQQLQASQELKGKYDELTMYYKEIYDRLDQAIQEIVDKNQIIQKLEENQQQQQSQQNNNQKNEQHESQEQQNFSNSDEIQFNENLNQIKSD